MQNRNGAFIFLACLAIAEIVFTLERGPKMRTAAIQYPVQIVTATQFNRVGMDVGEFASYEDGYQGVQTVTAKPKMPKGRKWATPSYVIHGIHATAVFHGATFFGFYDCCTVYTFPDYRLEPEQPKPLTTLVEMKGE